MKDMLIVAGAVSVVVAVIVMSRRRWQQQAAELIDTAIERNRFQYRKGMRRMDEALRDRTTAMRREREQAVESFKREQRGDRPRLHRAS